MQFQEIQTLLREFDQSSVGKLKIQAGDFLLELEKPTVVTTVAAPQAVMPTAVSAAPVFESVASVATAPTGTAATQNDDDTWLLAPMVGVYYASPSPESPPYIQVGQSVKKGQSICLLEAMKVMNEIQAEWDGVVEAILVANEEIVEYQQPMIRIRRV